MRASVGYADLGIFEQKDFFAVVVETDDGFHIRCGSAELLYDSESEAVVLDSLTGLQISHCRRYKVFGCSSRYGIARRTDCSVDCRACRQSGISANLLPESAAFPSCPVHAAGYA